MKNSQICSQKLGNPGLETVTEHITNQETEDGRFGILLLCKRPFYFILKTTPVDFYSLSAGPFPPGFSSRAI